MEELTFGDLIDLELDWIVMVEMIEDYQTPFGKDEVSRILLNLMNTKYEERLNKECKN